jgi:hypothetical protein
MSRTGSAVGSYAEYRRRLRNPLVRSLVDVARDPDAGKIDERYSVFQNGGIPKDGQFLDDRSQKSRCVIAQRGQERGVVGRERAGVL